MFAPSSSIMVKWHVCTLSGSSSSSSIISMCHLSILLRRTMYIVNAHPCSFIPHSSFLTSFHCCPPLSSVLRCSAMTMPHSKTLSKTDLLTWWNAAMEHAFERNLLVTDVAHVFDIQECQVYGLKKKWREGQDLTQVARPGCPCSHDQAWRNFQDSIAANPMHTVAQLSFNAHVSRMTSGCIMKDIGMKSRARECHQTLLPRDKRQRFAHATGLLQCLCDGVGLCIFLDEVKLDVTPYLNSTKDWIIEAVAWDAGDLGINQRHCGEGLWCWVLLSQMDSPGVMCFKDMREWHQQHILLLCSSFSHGWTIARTMTRWGTASSSRTEHPSTHLMLVRRHCHSKWVRWGECCFASQTSLHTPLIWTN